MSLDLNLYLPIAGNSVNCLAILGLGGIVGLLSGIFGVGGGFLMTPLLIMLGIPPTVAAASDSNQIVGASTSGTFAHFKLGNVDFKMGLLLLVGGVAGGSLGVQIIKVLRALGNADFLISITYVLMLGFVGGYMFLESLQALRKSSAPKADAAPKQESRYARAIGKLPFQMDFPRSGVRLSMLMPLLLGTLVGVLAAIMGVGGGFIMVPVMVYLLRKRHHHAVRAEPHRGLHPRAAASAGFLHRRAGGYQDRQEARRRAAQDMSRHAGSGRDGEDALRSAGTSRCAAGLHGRSLI
jgi:uncharacterized membrane protein YfcA